MAQKKVLVVDDDAGILSSVSFFLEEYGYRVKTLADGRMAGKMIQKFIPDVVLLDVMLSGVDGRKICRDLKKNKKYSQIPIIMISAHPTAKDGIADYGASAFVAKPFDADEILHKIRKYATR